MQSQRRFTAVVIAASSLLVALSSSHAHAQLFGERLMGGQGALQGNERFIRGNRSRRSFVGSDLVEQTSFVGAQQALASGRVRSATEGLRIDAVEPERINRPLRPQPAKGMYYPRLEVGWNQAESLNPETEVRLATTKALLQERIQRIGGAQIQVEVANSTAVVRGQVDSMRTAELITQLLKFEPGIDHVFNGLQVVANPR